MRRAGRATWWWMTLALMASCHSATTPGAAADPGADGARARAPQALTGAPQAHFEVIEDHAPRAPLDRLFTRLQALEQPSSARQHVSILHVGDSHVASDTMTGELRRQFQRRFGDAGRGYALAGRPWRSFRQDGLRQQMSRGWVTHHGMKRGVTGPFGVSGVRLSATKAGEQITRSGEPFTLVEIATLQKPEGGSLRVFADDQEIAVITTRLPEDAPEARALELTTLDLEEGASSLRLEVVGDGEVNVMGLSTQAASSGVMYHSVGLNGARAQTYLDFDAALTAQEVARLQPDLIVLGFGTNEAYNLRKTTLEPTHAQTHEAQLRALIARYREGAPEAACLVLLPMDLALKPSDPSCYERKRVKRGKRRVWERVLREDIDVSVEPQCLWGPPPSLAMIHAASERAARESGCAVWDQQAAMGGAGAMRAWAMQTPALASTDGVHLRLDGYHALARQLYGDLMEAYTRWGRGDHAELMTTSLAPEEEEDALTLTP